MQSLKLQKDDYYYEFLKKNMSGLLGAIHT